MKLNWVWMAETGNLFHAASSLCHTFHIRWRGVVGQSLRNPWPWCFQWITDLETIRARTAIEYPAYRRRSEYDMQHVVLHYFVGRRHLVGLEDLAQPLDTRRQKGTNLHSNDYQSELEIAYCVSNGCPNHHTRCRVPMPISKVSKQQVVSSKPPGTFTAIRILHTELRLVWKMTYHSCI